MIATPPRPPVSNHPQISPPVETAFRQLMERFNRYFAGLLAAVQHERPNVDAGQVRYFNKRIQIATAYIEPMLDQVFQWLFRSRELTNFTYDLTEANKDQLASMIAVIAGTDRRAARGYIDELNEDADLAAHIAAATLQSAHRHVSDDIAFYGRRLGWYALVRALKPATVVETGVDKGIGAVVLAAAILRNRAEGHPGHYIGTEINREAGFLFSGPYAEAGEILWGDSIESLQQLDVPVDLFINDSDHSADYEAREYDVIEPKLSAHALLLGDNAHATDRLFKFADRTGRQFLFFGEKPAEHWYPGAGIGIAFPANS